MFAVTFCAKKRTKSAIKNLLGEPGVMCHWRANIKNFTLTVSVLMAFVAVNIVALKYYNSFLDLFRMNGQTTVTEYLESDADARVDWILRMCNDGECLDEIDWDCGLYLELPETQKCVTDILLQVKPYIHLDTLRKYCGKKHSTRVNLQNYSYEIRNPGESIKRCEANGGKWHTLKNMPQIQFVK
jgi:hypothetical protein